jgi:RND family efflux transporter MFP subunit
MALLAPLGCGKSDSAEGELSATPVEVQIVAPESLSETSVLTGVLEAYRAVAVVCEVSGEIVSVRKDLGDHVSKGEILASVDKKVPRENLNQAEAALMAAKAAQEVARVDFSRDSTLFADGTISKAVFARSSLALTAAEAEFLAARAGRELAARQLANTEIRAPFSGDVSWRFAEIGGYVAPGMPAFRIVNIDSLRLRLGVSQSNMPRLRPGMEVRITSDALQNRVFDGHVRAVSPEADEMTRTFPVDVVLPNPKGHPLKDGLVVRASLVLDRHDGILAVPREAVLRQGELAFVFVIEDSLARRRDIHLGTLINNHYVVERGLAPGDQLVMVGMQNLRDGMPVFVETYRSTPSEHEGPAP